MLFFDESRVHSPSARPLCHCGHFGMLHLKPSFDASILASINRALSTCASAQVLSRPRPTPMLPFSFTGLFRQPFNSLLLGICAFVCSVPFVLNQTRVIHVTTSGGISPSMWLLVAYSSASNGARSASPSDCFFLPKPNSWPVHVAVAMPSEKVKRTAMITKAKIH